MCWEKSHRAAGNSAHLPWWESSRVSKGALQPTEEHQVPPELGERWKRLFTTEDTELQRSPWKGAQHGPSKEMQTQTRGGGCTHIRTALDKGQNKNKSKQKPQDQLVCKAVVGKSIQVTLGSKLFLTQSGVCLEQTWQPPPPPPKYVWNMKEVRQRIGVKRSENMNIQKKKSKAYPWGKCSSVHDWYLSFHLYLSWDTRARMCWLVLKFSAMLKKPDSEDCTPYGFISVTSWENLNHGKNR